MTLQSKTSQVHCNNFDHCKQQARFFGCCNAFIDFIVCDCSFFSDQRYLYRHLSIQRYSIDIIQCNVNPTASLSTSWWRHIALNQSASPMTL